MAKAVSQKSFFPTLISSAHELYAVNSETNKYTLRKSTIEQVLSSVEEKNKSLKIATVGIIASKGNDRHKKYTDLLIQYLEHRLRTNDKIVEKFLKDFDEKCTRETSSSNGVYFWPKIYTITSRKKERCRLLILFFDGVSNRTLDILASAVCSQLYVFKEVGKNILATELHTLRESFTKTSNVTLRNSCTTVIKSENEPARSYRMFLKDWVNFRLDFFKNKDTMFTDWEQLLRYLVKTESAINAYISRTELQIIGTIPVLPSNQRSKLPEKLEAEPLLRKVITKGQPLPGLSQGHVPKQEALRKSVPLTPPVVPDNKAQRKIQQAPVTHSIVKENVKINERFNYQPVSTKDLLDTIKVIIYSWIAKKLTIANIDSMLDCCENLLSFDRNGIFDELDHLKFAIIAYNSEIANMFDHHVSFQKTDQGSPLQEKSETLQQNLHKMLQCKCLQHFDLISYLFQHACLELKHQYCKDNELISLHETNNSKRVSDKIYDTYRRKLGQNVNSFELYEQAVEYHEKIKSFCLGMLARCLGYDSRHNHVLYNESILLTKTLDNYFQLVCEGIPWTKSKPTSPNREKIIVFSKNTRPDNVRSIGNEIDSDLVNIKIKLSQQCASITNQLNKREVILRPLTRKVIEESLKRAHDVAYDKFSTKDMLVSEASDINELVLEYGFQKI